MARVLSIAFAVLAGLPVAAMAQNAAPAAELTQPDFVGYVPDEFIVVFRPAVLDRLMTAEDADGNPQISLPSVQRLLEQYGVERFHPQFPAARKRGAGSTLPEMSGHYKVKLPRGRDLDSAVRAFEADLTVDHVEKIGMHRLYIDANDPFYQGSPSPTFPFDQWHYWDTNGIGANLAWDSVTGDSTVAVGILDSGTRYFHIDLGGPSAQWGPNNPFSGGNIFINSGEIPNNGQDDDGNGFVDDTIGWDFVSSAGGGGVSCIDQDCSGVDNDPDDGNGHGTHVSGTVGAITNNGNQVAGVAGGFSDGSGLGNGVKIIPLRIGYHARFRGATTGVVRMDWAAEAMNYVADLKNAGNNVAAINCSWGSSNSGGLDAAVNNLLASDVMIVHAAGNSGNTSADYLGNKAGVMNVAATDINGNGASFTNHGSYVDVAAPGVDVVSTYRNPDDPDPAAHYIALLGGTSMSAPHVCGIAALLESCTPSLSGPDKFTLIVNNTQPYFDSRDLGSGIANARLALDAAGCGGTPCDVLADFSGDSITGCASLTVNFTDLTTGAGISSWFWDFGDGQTSTAQNPANTYSAAGTYTVNLTATGTNCSDSNTQVDYITVSEVPVASFSGMPVSGNTPLSVSFSDSSSGNPDTWSWTFGDGGTSSAQSPSYTYTVAGTYSVTLTASNACGSDSLTRVDYIVVTDPSPTTSMSVFDIVVVKENLGGGNKQGVATVTIVDGNGSPVAGATVVGDFSGKTIDSGVSGTTDSNGQVTLNSSSARGGGQWCFQVTNVTHGSLTYDSGSNNVTQSCENGDVF